MVTPSSSAESRLSGLPTNVLFVGQRGSVPQRDGGYSPASVRGHPGKMLPDLARALVELYTRPGDLVLDPMSGIGTTGVEAVRLGRRYVGVEVEPRFAAWQRGNLRAARKAGASGEFFVRCGDARELVPASTARTRPGLPVPPVDAVVTSPPYGDRLREQSNPSRRLRELLAAGRFGRNVLPGIYGRTVGNLGNLARAAHLREMGRVYAACFQILRPGGIMAIVVQPERARRELLPLHHDTARVCRDVGFVLLDELVAVLGRVAAREDGAARLVAHASFWRRLTCAQLRDAGLPVTLGQVEHVLVFRKPDGDPLLKRNPAGTGRGPRLPAGKEARA